ncbi:MAG: AI-2E family transporter [Bacteroidales bacterium]
MNLLTRINHILLFVIAASVVVYFGSSFLVPFIFGIFLASLMTPFSNLQERIGINRFFSSLISTLVVFIVIGGLLYLFSFQIRQFLQDLPILLEKLQGMFKSLQAGVSRMTGFSMEDQQSLIQKRSEDMIGSVEKQLTGFLGSMIDTVAKFLLMLIYVFLMLLYRDRFKRFIMMYIDSEKKEEAEEVTGKISKVVYQYLWGRAQVMTLLGIMYYITFVIFGLPFALLLTVFGALITIIPYVGPFIATVIPIMFAIIYLQEAYQIVLFVIIISIVQLIESYVLEPLIIGKEVKLNPLIVIIAILIGSMAWGLAGMILFVPIFAIIKIIANHTEGLHPVGYLFSNKK